MTFNRLLKCTLLCTLLGVLLMVAIAVGRDPFAIFWRDPRAQAPTDFYDYDRLFKFWLATRQIPARFESVILGPSFTTSLDPLHLGREDIYNLSFRAANSAEMTILASALIQPAMSLHKLAVCIDPYVVRSMNPRTDELSRKSLRMAYGSWPLIAHFFTATFFPVNPLAKHFSAAGANDEYDYLDGTDSSPRIEKWMKESDGRYRQPFPTKARAVDQLVELVALARRAHLKLLLFIQPKPRAQMAEARASFQTYLDQISTRVGPVDRVLAAPLASGFDWDDRNFVDGAGHLSRQGSDAFMRALASELDHL